ncbi:MFS transporter [Variovorax sp. ZS18.2.2]|uniref:MFS transporter n=1 Tax=Variovorax sp. ZS18.2.2 TaxID=2971255 RepID=UPI00215181FB|nr:MFS transporter [Variovorax sp. ZS18.2.2]MCR6478192.1 MFS transporter [Variovorax sp. ZS18.2.2]
MSALRSWSVVAVLLVLSVLASVNRNAIALMVDPIRHALGVGDAQMGLLQGPAFAIFFLLGSLPMGWVVDRFSSKWAIYLGVTGWSLATIACGLAGTFVEMVVARCFVGLCQAILQPAGWTVVARIFPAHRLSLAIGVLSSGAQIGAAGSYLLGGFLLAQAGQWGHVAGLPWLDGLAPWQLVFVVAGLPGLALALLIFIAPSTARRAGGQGASAAHGWLNFVRSRRAFLACHFAGFGLHSAAVFGAAAWVPTYLSRVHGLDVQTVGLILAVAAVPVGMVGVLSTGWFVDRAFARGRRDAHLRHFSRVAASVAMIGGLGFFLAPSLPVSLAIVVLVFGAIQFLQPFSGVSGAVLQIVAPDAYRGRISAAYIMFYNAVGMTLGPSTVAFLSDRIGGPDGLGTALALSYAFFGGCAALVLHLGRRHAVAAIAQAHRESTPITGALSS